jgi:mercuric ion transport protein
MGSKRTLLSIGIIVSIFNAVCSFTPLLVVLVGIVGLSAMTGYLDYVLFPALIIFVGILIYALTCKTG